MSKTTMEKLTLADAMKYPNAEIRLYRFENEKEPTATFDNVYDMIAVMNGNSQDDEGGLLSEDECMLQTSLLQLRQLSSLTEEEKKECQNVYGDFDSSCLIQTPIGEITTNSIRSLDYLRSINVDIDGFIEKGVAIHAE